MYKRQGMQLLTKTLIVLIGLTMGTSLNGQIFKKKKEEAPIMEKKEDSKKKDSKIKKYSDVITKDAITTKGLVHTHKVDDVHYFEIPDSVLNQELLITVRISGFVKNLNFGGAGVESRPQSVIRWQRKNNQILLRAVSYNSVANFEDPIYQSVRNNNFEPIIMAFDIKAFGKDSSSVVIDVNPLFTTDVDLIGPMDEREKRQFGIRALDAKRSYIEKMRSFPKNTEVRYVLTYNGNALPDNRETGTMSVEMTLNMVELPKIPMKPRLYDDRVSYFSINQTNYSSNDQRASDQRFITKWRLEPKDEDIEKYKRGELVEPKNPIIYYIDPATPLKWRPYLKQGVDDWQRAFEAAGFKNAIMAKDPPTPEEDPDWSPEDVRYSVIRYVSTDIQNAMGPHVHDPRTGEIIESDIIWYHNVMNLLRNWFFIQTAAINPEARGVNFKEEVMGRLIRFVSAHEVGHTLGLPHNMGASAAYPVDSLRSPAFTKRMGGPAPSIMDYARFNYVAQPGDGDVALMPDIGPYDVWSIEFGYRLIYDAATPEEERPIINDWIKQRAKDPVFRFGRQRGLAIDPTAQTEDLGDNSMKASAYGIENLKRIVPNLIDWTNENAGNFAQLKELYDQVWVQYGRYMGHVTANVGGVYEYYKTYDQKEGVYTHVERERQKEAVRFLNQQLFNTPLWYINQEVITRAEEFGVAEKIRGMQERTLTSLISPERLRRMSENSALNGPKAYGIIELFDDLSEGVFSELKGNQTIDIYRRNLQRTFVEVLEKAMKEERTPLALTDMKAVIRGNLKDLLTRLTQSNIVDKASRYHVEDLAAKIKSILDPK